MSDFRLRVTFSKLGRLAMLSHLELARALTRTVRRADLPYALTQGFSPHMKIAFGAALPVGIESICEIFDVSLLDYVPVDAALERLQAVSAPDLMPHAARYLVADEAAASIAYPISRYEARLNVSASLLHVPESIVVVRKKREKVLDPAEFIRSLSFGTGNGSEGGRRGVGAGKDAGGDRDEAESGVKGAGTSGGTDKGEGGSTGAGAGTGADESADKGENTLTFELEAKPTGSLRPDVLLSAMLRECGNADARVISVVRVGQRSAEGFPITL